MVCGLVGGLVFSAALLAMQWPVDSARDSAAPGGDMAPVVETLTPTPTGSRTPPPSALPGIPGRATATPSGLGAETPVVTPVVTSPFTLPTRPPRISPTPQRDCMIIFPIDIVLAIELGQTTIPQLEAAFGQADYVGGRPVSFRFEDGGCEMKVMVGIQTAEEIELISYGDLDWLLTEFGPPEAVGVTAGNLVYLMEGHAILLYPEQGIVAFFDVDPGELTRKTAISVLNIRRPYEVEKQLARLNAEAVDWQPPLR
jgi:hypothetical protein